MGVRPPSTASRPGLTSDPPRRSRRFIAPVALLVVFVASIVLVVAAERAPAAPTSKGATAPTTPVLSARRAPELLAAPVADRRLVTEITGLLAAAPADRCLTVAVGGRIAYAENPTAPMIPASIEKLLTTQAILDTLGADAVLTTKVDTTAPAEGGTVNGDVWLVGGGDPLLMTDAYAQHFKHQPVTHSDLGVLADRITNAGVTHITGRVVGDDGRYDRQRYLPQWPTRFATLAEIGPMSALTVNDGLVAFPPTPDAHTPKETPADDPAQQAADQLRQLLVARGVTVDGPAASGAAPPDAPQLASLDSVPVGQMVAAMLTESDNGTAELLTKELGVRASGTGTTAAGVAAITKALQADGLPLDGTVQFDGSGLATDDKVTCTAVQALLDRHGPTSTFAADLPVAAQTGTLLERFVGTPLAGRLRAKTGTLNESTALAGYLTTTQGVDLSFTFIMNVNPPAKVTTRDVAFEEQLANILVQYPQSVDVAKLSPQP